MNLLKKIINIIETVLIIGVLIGCLICWIFDIRWTFIKKDQIVVEQAMIDSINAIAQKPPRIDTLIVEKLIEGSETSEPELVDIDTTSTDPIIITSTYKDTLITPDFSVSIFDSIINSIIVKRNWEYTLMRKEQTITIERFVPIVVDKPVPMNMRTFLIGGEMLGFTKGNGFVTTGKFIYGDKQKNFFSISGGYKFGTDPSPVIGFGYYRKF